MLSLMRAMRIGLAGCSVVEHSDGSEQRRIAAKTLISAEMTLPPRMAHGCARGLARTANSRTADAPIGAISTGINGDQLTHHAEIAPVMAMPCNAPNALRSQSPATMRANVMGIRRSMFDIGCALQPIVHDGKAPALNTCKRRRGLRYIASVRVAGPVRTEANGVFLRQPE